MNSSYHYFQDGDRRASRFQEVLFTLFSIVPVDRSLCIYILLLRPQPPSTRKSGISLLNQIHCDSLDDTSTVNHTYNDSAGLENIYIYITKTFPLLGRAFMSLLIIIQELKLCWSASTLIVLREITDRVVFAASCPEVSAEKVSKFEKQFKLKAQRGSV